MVFEQTQQGSKPKNQFSATIVSAKGNTMGVFYPSDLLCREVFGVLKPHEVTYEQAEAILPGMLKLEGITLKIKDISGPLVTTKPGDF